MDASVLLRRVNKILTGGNMETKCGAETEEKAIQRLPHLGIHPIFGHQTETLLQMPRRTCWKEPGSAIPWGHATVWPIQIHLWCLQITIRLSTGTPMEELEEGLTKFYSSFIHSSPELSSHKFLTSASVLKFIVHLPTAIKRNRQLVFLSVTILEALQ